MKASACALALTLLSALDKCPSCGWPANDHPGWRRELARGAIPNPGPELEEELELEADDGDRIAASISSYPAALEEELPRVRWAVGGGSPWRGASPPASRPEELDDDASPALEAQAVRRAPGASRRARLVAAALRSSAASLLALADALEDVSETRPPNVPRT